MQTLYNTQDGYAYLGDLINLINWWLVIMLYFEIYINSLVKSE